MKVKLKRILARPEVSSLLGEMLKLTETPICIVDGGGNCLLGDRDGSATAHPILLRGEPVGWVEGPEMAATAASLLSYLVEREWECKTLANETLERYKEINLLYRVSEKLSAVLDLQSLARLVLEEAMQVIGATGGFAISCDEETQTCETIAIAGETPDISRHLGEKIATSIPQFGRPEIVNDIASDGRFLSFNSEISAFLFSPLKNYDRILGALGLLSSREVAYTASDLKLLTAIASQAANAIENIRFYEYRLQEERIKANLERYMSPQLARAVIDSKEENLLKNCKKNLVILFSDIRNFTSKCEELQPEKMVEYLNIYFESMVNVIFDHGGTVNKFVGDMIVCMFGAPASLEECEKRAIEAAIGMQARLKTIPNDWIRENFRTGIGISSGEVVVGNIGSPHHVDYTAIGDQVNVASRLQSLAKGGQILAGRSIYDATRHHFNFREVGIVKVKGKKNKIEVFEVLY
ncbi:adenylate/guanylate cyclase domain-containing protein [Lyngbya sp. CCY1209]|uniref:adenylate/guanylate cyclase domain-containing protein n=1 Tax=Lyngbya sp. CCY1209 TaxID=2886103 RepID=UPI002D20C496|nr:adenylate/guanylate cyclase domain-containing protein [Lyngbya sp. CCY1209]MEB3885145.1 GAF domain-containing protein [Lyngbya sp. CCY1209]